MTNNEIRIHAIQTGRLVGNRTFLRGERWSSLLRRPQPVEFPVLSFVVEHPDGLIAIDTGLSPRVRSPRPLVQRRFAPCPVEHADLPTGMRALGLDPGNVRKVVITHLDWDHAGGLEHFPGAEVLVHRPEWEFAHSFSGRQRCEPRLWPERFAPTLYDLDDEPYGPFPASRAITPDGSLRVVPLPGHTPGQVGVVVRSGDTRFLFCADHVLNQDWFFEDWDAGRLLGLGIWQAKSAKETSRRLHRFLSGEPTVLVPSHDADAPARLAGAQPTINRKVKEQIA